jgi:branched-chain amino acid transport system substrate-binding protein
MCCPTFDGLRSAGSVDRSPLGFVSLIGGKHMRARWWATLCVLALALGTLAVPGAAAAPRASSGETLLIGQMNTETNPANPGTKTTSGRDTLAAWAKMVNASGGINGMQVKIMAADDGGDPAKASKNIKDMIDAGVVAIVSPGSITPAVWTPIAAEAGVPVIGGGCYSATAGSDQNFFCVTTTAILDGLKAQFKYAADQGGKVFGTTYASDNPQAAAAAPLFKSLAGDYGMTYSDGVGTTNTAPDYTSVCLTFKQSDTTDVGIEGAPMLPALARDCARQNYFPKWSSGDGQISTNSWLKDPNIKVAIAAVYSFPYMLTKGETSEQTESLQQFQSAMKKYAPKVLSSDAKQPATTIWTGALAFGKAAESIPAGTTPTPALITAGMNSFSGETLGGLAPNPITFTAGQDHPHNSCWWGVVLKNHKLTAPAGMKTTCTP